MFRKKLLLIGKNSFISTNIYSRLKKKLFIKKISFEKFKKYKKNKINKFDYICNCSITKNYIKKKYELKSDLDFYIAHKIKELSPKFIFLSSRKIYPSKANLKESTQPSPKDIYSKNKLISEYKIKETLNNNLIILRISNIIGKPLKNKRRKVSNTFIDNFFKYKKHNIIFYENHFKDFLSIEQFTKIFYEILRVNPNGLFNVSLGKKIYISEIIKPLNKKRLIKFQKTFIKKRDSFYLNNQKLKKIIKIKINKKDLLDYCSKI